MQHRDGDDEGEVEPVGDEDVRLLALDQRAKEHQQVDYPDDGEPQIRIPFGLGIFLRLRYSEQVARAGNEDEEVVPQHHEPRREFAGNASAARLLNYVEGGRDQHIAAERKDHGGGMQRPDAAEIEPGQIEVEGGPRELERRPETNQETCDAPEYREPSRELDRSEIVVRLAADLLRGQRSR